MMRISKEPMTVDELRRYVAPRFGTIRKDIHGLKRDVRGLKRDVRGLKRDVRGLKRDVRALKGDVRGLKGDVRGLKGDVRGLKDDLWRVREYVHESAVETRRHFDIVAESVRSEIRLLADGFDSHSQRLDDHDSRISRLEQRR